MRIVPHTLIGSGALAMKGRKAFHISPRGGLLGELEALCYAEGAHTLTTTVVTYKLKVVYSCVLP